ncbi:MULTISPECIES: cytidyltransferase [unclassified Fusibacter]|uniref:cytidyltransferase n=1 Tax=unclassified Fusibacter TaxID=2624464 RepID=UPI0010133617|nr:MULTISPECIES: cytidyltransferase [unclassified Fusibacter]MCK8058260.1 cytidyltransferase [Fusibacter sp. A2]NPE20843.1 cytidyltransferase [Fusibacter sp. A1]RXV63048.1 cytidyltransferase [Fusibacter sp. A1]
MYKEKAKVLYHDLLAIAGEIEFIRRHHMNKELVDYHLHKTAFKDAISSLVKDRDFSAKRLLSIVEELLVGLSKGKKPDDWMLYIYSHTLNKNFAEAVQIEFDLDFDGACELFIALFKCVNELQKKLDDGSFQSAYPFELLSGHEIDELESPEEYRRFVHLFEKNAIYEMMKLNYEIMGYTTLDHICGVHYLALRIARQLKSAGISIDLGRVSGAAAGHDIGKYGCKPEEGRRVAYLHYFYTGEWFDNRKMPYIRNVAVNHSTWDLELENLSVESLVLIYSDFCVKAPEEAHPFSMKFYSLKESFKVILNKLDNVDEAKEKRYKKVYAKLRDFEYYMLDLGVQLNIAGKMPTDLGEIKPRKMYALMYGADITKRFKELAIEHNIGMMNLFRDEASMNAILEHARSEEDLYKLRGYLSMLSEYYMYLTQKQKSTVLGFLFERLTHPEEDIRQECAEMMGEIIASYDEKHRKELPEDVDLSLFKQESILLLGEYFTKFLEADVATTPKHRGWIGNALGYFVESLLVNADKSNVINYTKVVLDYFEKYRKDEELHPYLLKVLKYLPIDRCKDSMQLYVMTLIYKMALQNSIKTRLEALDALRRIIRFINPSIIAKMNYNALFDQTDTSYPAVLEFMKSEIMATLTGSNVDNVPCVDDDPAHLYLSNLKTATPSVVKRLQIDMLVKLVKQGRIDAFYTALHFSNLLKVSAYQEVRQSAGNALVRIFDKISIEQKNDIVVELLRALEIEGYQFTKFIPIYLGKLLNRLSDVEHDEIINDFIEKMKVANPQTCTLVLDTASVGLVDQFKRSRETGGIDDRSIKKLFSVLFNGLVHYEQQVSQSAFNVIGSTLFGSTILTIEEKSRLYGIVAKKILTIITNVEDETDLMFMSNASALNHMYRFISDYMHEFGVLEINSPNKVAFFPGAFDPFSLAHKASACKIRNLGFEVYLAVDEFSWSKRTQPNMIRRNITKMSIADELDIYTFPRNFVVNIGNPVDLLELKEVFEPRDVHLVMGSDVLTHASAYKNEEVREVLLTLSHIIFERAQGMGNVKDEVRLEEVIKNIKGDVIRMSLDRDIENISSTQIRTFVDQNRDISDLTESLVQKYIYDKGLYRREPQFKDTMTIRSLSVKVIDDVQDDVLLEVCQTFGLDFDYAKDLLNSKIYANATRLLIIRDLKQSEKIIACSLFHWLRSSMIYFEFESGTLSDYIRDQSVGRIVVVDALLVDPDSSMKNPEQVILTETLAYCIAKDYSYAIYRDIFNSNDPNIIKLLALQGFESVVDEDDNEVHVVNMSSPISLSLDGKSMIKAPYRNAKGVSRAIVNARERLQRALCDFYPGNLVLSFDRMMIYEHLIKKICDSNGVSTVPTNPRELGDSICVTYGDIFKRWTLPNTVTKAFHTERYYNPEVTNYKVMAYPHYLDLDIQSRTIKSYNRPVILVDDLMDKGYRFKAIWKYLKDHDVELKQLTVAILSGRGKAWLEMNDIPVESAYFIPRLKLWFNESILYPYLGGDTLWRGKLSDSNLLPSINLILPFVYPRYIKDVNQEKIANFSMVCLQNAYEIMEALEKEYLRCHERNLTLSNLSEVMLSPRFPDKGNQVAYHMNAKPTEFIKNDIELMNRIVKQYQNQEVKK